MLVRAIALSLALLIGIGVDHSDDDGRRPGAVRVNIGSTDIIAITRNIRKAGGVSTTAVSVGCRRCRRRRRANCVATSFA